MYLMADFIELLPIESCTSLPVGISITVSHAGWDSDGRSLSISVSLTPASVQASVGLQQSLLALKDLEVCVST